MTRFFIFLQEDNGAISCTHTFIAKSTTEAEEAFKIWALSNRSDLFRAGDDIVNSEGDSAIYGNMITCDMDDSHLYLHTLEWLVEWTKSENDLYLKALGEYAQYVQDLIQFGKL